MKALRNIIFWIHLVSGLLAGIFIFIMCVTGALLSFQANILKYVESDMRHVAAPAADAKKLPVKDIVGKVLESRPKAKPSNVTIYSDPQAAALVALGREGQIYVNPYTGEIAGEGARGTRSFFRTVEDLHRWLAFSGDARNVGKQINGAANVLFALLALTGIYIWFPRRFTPRHFKAALRPRWQLKGKARDFNWHTTLGFWTSLVLIVLTITGMMIAYQWFGNLAYTLTGNTPPQSQASPNAPNPQQGEQPFAMPENTDVLWAKAENQSSWKSIALRLPVGKDAVFTIDEGVYWNIFGRSTLTVNAQTAEVAKWEPYGEQNAGRQIRSWARFTHTGESFGFIGQLIGFIACLIGALLVWTGVTLALRRFQNWRKP